MKKRKYIDIRNWKEYNEELVMRGYFYVNPKFLETWNDEIKKMNAGKVGEPYFYPKTMIEFLAVLHCKGFDFRALEGFMMGLSRNYRYHFPIISYSQISRRFNKLDINFGVLEEDMEDYLLVGSDGSGEKSTKRGGWMREKWKVKKGWIKVVIMGCKNKNGKKYIIDIRVGTETMDERAATRSMIKSNHENIGRFTGDGLHDCAKTFKVCRDYDIPVSIKIRKNASLTTRQGYARRQEVLIFKSMPYDEWVREKEYGQRWPITEGLFSGDKRIFGEYVSATKKKNMYHEVRVRFWAYNQLLMLNN